MSEPIKRLIKSFDPRSKFFHSLHSASRVLDVGCGEGRNGATMKVLHPEIEVHGLDILPSSAVAGYHTYKKVDLDAGVLPWPDEYFDAIVFTHVIEHLRIPLQLSPELHRLMKHGAKLFIEAPNWTSVFVPSFGFHREQHGPFNFFDDPTHLKPWSMHGLHEYLSQFCCLRVERVGNCRSWLRIPADFAIILFGLLTGNRNYVISAVWNIVGWSIYGIGVKE